MPKLNFKHFPALDGIRGVAIISVMFFHSSVLNLQGGFLGVDVFFVLSGFLISSLLLKEFGKDGKINLKQFYLKRLLRLMPASVFLLTCLWIAVLVLGDRFATKPANLGPATLYTFFYSANWAIIFGFTDWPAAIIHFWSLAIEEQFYLLWPFIFWGLLKLKIKAAKISVLLTILVTGLVLWRIYLWNQHVPFGRVYFATDTRLGSLFLGCMLAIIVSGDLLPSGIEKFANLLLGFSFFVLLTCMFYLNNGTFETYYGGFEIAGLMTCCMIIGSLFSKGGVVKILESKILIWFGKLSYGIYLWHGVIFYFFEGIQFPLKENKLVFFSLQFGVSLLAATLSYHLIEKQFLKIKNRLNEKKTTHQLSGDAIHAS